MLARWAALGAVAAHGAAAASLEQPAALGPGKHAWTRGRPSDHGLTEAALAAAGTQLQLEAPAKECFAVAKGGELLYELDYRTEAGKPATLIESDSAGKTITALVIGVLVTKYNISLDSSKLTSNPRCCL